VRLLANENFPRDAVDVLRANGHDVAWVRTDAPGSSDDAVLARAQQEQRLLITFDKDFGELVFAKGQAASQGVVLFRIGMPSPSIVATKVASVLDSRGDWAGHFSVVDDTRIRMIPLPGPANP
jgi:predicted nuclease of predicted toxin-antitoxin system